jgi:periplasmic protein TonB
MLSTKALSARLVCAIFLSITFALPSWAQSQAFTDWVRNVATHLKKHHQVRPDSQSREGEVLVFFTLDRSGKITSTKIAKSSGITDLDTAALRGVENAQPFPAPPAEVDDSQLSFTLPIAFKKRGVLPVSPVVPEGNEPDEKKLKEQLRGICRGC